MIFVECKPDYILVRKFGFSKRQIVHAGNISEVCKNLQRNQNCCGLVDEDPYGTRPTYMVNLLQSNLISENYNIKIAHDRKRNNHLIVICPRLEEWFYETARLLHIDLRRFGLPNNPEKLHVVINSNLSKFELLLEEILQQDNPRVNELRQAFVKCQQSKPQPSRKLRVTKLH